MTKSLLIEELEFHDSSIREISTESHVLSLQFENVSYPPLKPSGAGKYDIPLVDFVMNIIGFDTIRQDDRDTTRPSMLGVNSGIIDAQLSSTRIYITLTWYNEGKSFFGSFEILVPELSITCGPYTMHMPE